MCGREHHIVGNDGTSANMEVLGLLLILKGHLMRMGPANSVLAIHDAGWGTCNNYRYQNTYLQTKTYHSFLQSKIYSLDITCTCIVLLISKMITQSRFDLLFNTLFSFHIDNKIHVCINTSTINQSCQCYIVTPQYFNQLVQVHC